MGLKLWGSRKVSDLDFLRYYLWILDYTMPFAVSYFGMLTVHYHSISTHHVHFVCPHRGAKVSSRIARRSPYVTTGAKCGLV